METGSLMIQCDNLVKIYKTKETEVMALQGLDITVNQGELMAVIGNSGSGKSTFLNMIGALDIPTAGKLFVDGKDLFALNNKEILEYKRRTVGFVWQNNARNLIPYLNSLENVQVPMMFTKGKERKKQAEKLIEIMGMTHKINAYPLQMSGGEQQRIAIAVALANQPKILLADEPTGAVDIKTSEHIFRSLRDINRIYGTTIVIVTHDIKIAEKVNRVASIRDGKISSERLLKTNNFGKMDEIKDLSEEEKEEFSILDRAGRLQLSREILERGKITNNRVRVEFQDGRIVILPSDSVE